MLSSKSGEKTQSERRMPRRPSLAHLNARRVHRELRARNVHGGGVRLQTVGAQPWRCVSAFYIINQIFGFGLLI